MAGKGKPGRGTREAGGRQAAAGPSLPPVALPPEAPPPGVILNGMTIFLYRDTRSRPREDFYAVNFAHDPASPYRFVGSFSASGGTLFEVYADVCSFKRDHPLWFHNDAHALDLKSFTITTFNRRGGGGRGVRSSRKSDEATLFSLFEAVRSFPEGWEREPGMIPQDKERKHNGAVSRSI